MSDKTPGDEEELLRLEYVKNSDLSTKSALLKLLQLNEWVMIDCH